MTNMIAHYFDDTLAAGYAAQNQMFATLCALLMGEAKQYPEDREAIAKAAQQMYAELIKGQDVTKLNVSSLTPSLRKYKTAAASILHGMKIATVSFL